MNKKYLELILFFTVVSVLSLGNIANICKIFSPLNFDNQALLTWQYTASIGMIPYRDVFYPYGLLNYFKSQHILFAGIYFLLTPVLFTAVFLFFKELFKNKLLHYLSFSIFFAFILFITGFETFSRYGIAVALVIAFSFLFFYRNKHFYRWLFLLGIGVGAIFSLINDQGVYGVMLFFVYAFVEKSSDLRATFFHIKKAKSLQASLIREVARRPEGLIKETGVFIGGFILGFIPFFVYLVQHDALAPFIAYLKTIPELSLYAKTPFFHAVASMSNLITLSVLIAALLVLSHKFFISKQKVQVNTYVQIGLVFILILFEQKSIIRSMDTQLTFIAFILLVSLLYDLSLFLQKKKFSIAKQNILLLGLLFLVFLLLKQSTATPVQLPSLQHVVTMTSIVQNRSCVTANVKHAPTVYTDVKKAITKDKSFNGNVFSFPSDPLFYLLFDQKPPHYPNAYDGSAYHAQQDTIAYIEKNNIQYVILNTEIKAIQDEVPDYIRTPHVFAYIINNFKPYTSVEGYLILKKDPKKDFFRSDMQKEYKDFLLNVNLENIPRSEGYHKYKNYERDSGGAQNDGNVVESSSLEKVNAYLKKNAVESKKTFLVLDLNGSEKKENVSFIIRSRDGLSTRVSMRQCESGLPCIIHLSRLPLFYKNRIVQDITEVSGAKLSSMKIVEVSDPSRFW